VTTGGKIDRADCLAGWLLPSLELELPLRWRFARRADGPLTVFAVSTRSSSCRAALAFMNDPAKHSAGCAVSI
jgi:hypothetical protein